MTAEDFEQERRYLIQLAYRMLGSVTDAEDVVQEAFLRWRHAGSPVLDSPRAWFTRTCTRLCLDQLKSARAQREEYPGEWLPEPWSAEPGERTELDETLSMALLLTVQKLRPAERAAFLLHDVFGYTFSEVASILDLEPAHCRQLAARARRRLRGDSPPPAVDQQEVEKLSRAFFGALASGDLGALQSVLAADVVLRADGGGKAAAARRPIHGSESVARFFYRIFCLATAGAYQHHFSWLNGAPGVLVFEHGRVVSAFHFQCLDGRIAGIFVQRNPDKLMRLNREMAPLPTE